MGTLRVVGGTLAAVGMINGMIHREEHAHPHQEGAPDVPPGLTRALYEVNSGTVMPPGRQVFAPPREDDYYAHHVAQMSTMMMRRNVALLSTTKA